MKRKLRMIGGVVGGLVLVLLGAMVLAALTEPAPLVGEAHASHPAVSTLARAEDELFRGLGVASTSRTLTLPSSGMRAHVREVPGEGPPIVFVHGGGSMLSSWAPLVPHLAGRHLFLVDRPGCGQTEGFAYTGEVDLRRHAVEFLGDVMDELELPRAALVGNSMGGLWSIWFSLEHPERVASLALVGCPALWPGTSAPVPQRLLGRPGIGALMLRLQPGGRDATREVLARVAGEHAVANVPDALVEVALAGRSVPGTMTSFRTLMSQALTLSGASPHYQLTIAQLQELRPPTLLVWGSADIYGTPADAERIVAGADNLRLEVVDGGHLPWLDQPEAVARVLATSFDDPA